MNPQYVRALPRATSSAVATLRPSPRAALSRLYATQSNPNGTTKRRRNITVLSDDGRYEWGDLSGREKVSRATQQSFNFVVVIAGVVLTVGSYVPTFARPNIKGLTLRFVGWCLLSFMDRCHFPEQSDMAI